MAALAVWSVYAVAVLVIAAALERWMIHNDRKGNDNE